MKLRIATLILPLAVATYVSAAVPSLSFGPAGVTMANLQPGTRVAWMSLTRTPASAYHSRIELDRGIGIAEQTSLAAFPKAAADTTRSLWVVAAIEQDIAGAVASPAYKASPSAIAVTATNGANTISVVSPSVELMLVRPNVGAWYVGATDGAGNDQDDLQNTTIAISLQSLQALDEGDGPPATIANGDVILLIDPRRSRTAVVKVGE